ncbi:hypothetical protein RHSIM_Rhsim08G0028700 [Rhododendron simsii]|uniref:Protein DETOXIFICATION n=1 Tax=Rhododendron simsii TaxID=118357 RepID=A0A834GKY9_RHOSS|nr:hypothetical protein RHSIM_Rhsim08G0028700 [Rhododendron simsii]
MTVTKVAGALICGISGKGCERRTIGQAFEAKTSTRGLRLRFPGVNHRVGLRFDNVVRNCGLVSGDHALDYDFSPTVEEMVVLDTERAINGSTEGYIALTGTSTSQLDPPNVQTELIMLSLPAIAGQAIEPLAQLMETAYIGRLGPLELASAGVSISIFNIVSKVFNIPLLSIATSFVAEDISKNAGKESTTDERKPLSSVSTALLLAAGIGICEALALYLGSGLFLNIMGISAASPMRVAAQHFLRLRALGAPAVVLSLAIQGIFRGFKDTKTPVLCLGKYIVTILMIWYLNKRTVLLLPNIKDLDFGGYIRSGGFLLGRTLAAVMTITLSTSMAARQGPIAMAAHQICLQVWLSVSLLADAQAASGQALIASYFAKGDYKTVREITFFALKTGLFTGVFLAVALGVSFSSFATLFTNDKEVLDIIRSVLLFVSASQPFNALAYIFDGLHYGVSDFSYAASSMMIVGAMSSAFLLYAPSVIGLSGVWFGLTLFMGLRTVAGYLRLPFNK